METHKYIEYSNVKRREMACEFPLWLDIDETGQRYLNDRNGCGGDERKTTHTNTRATADRALPKPSSRRTIGKGLSNSNGGYRPMQIAARRRALCVLMGQWHRANLARALHFCNALPPALSSLALPLPAFLLSSSFLSVFLSVHLSLFLSPLLFVQRIKDSRLLKS